MKLCRRGWEMVARWPAHEARITVVYNYNNVRSSFNNIFQIVLNMREFLYIYMYIIMSRLHCTNSNMRYYRRIIYYILLSRGCRLQGTTYRQHPRYLDGIHIYIYIYIKYIMYIYIYIIVGRASRVDHLCAYRLHVSL